jgi:hypothetical protein
MTAFWVATLVSGSETFTVRQHWIRAWCRLMLKTLLMAETDLSPHWLAYQWSALLSAEGAVSMIAWGIAPGWK